MDSLTYVSQFISSFISGPTAEAMKKTIAEQVESMQKFSINVTDQLSICTSGGSYLDKQASRTYITRPAELGMSDLAFQTITIKINAAKQIATVIHVILEAFYGAEAVRAFTQCQNAEPYELEVGQQLIFQLEDGIDRVATVQIEDFENVSSAKASEVATMITKAIRSEGLLGYGEVYSDIITNAKYVRIYGGAKGPYSTVMVTDGEVQSLLQFPSIRPSSIGNPDTAWQVTRTQGSVYRFRWIGNSKPALEEVIQGDTVNIYGPGFASVGFGGSYRVVGLRPAGVGPSLTSGYFEVSIEDGLSLGATAAGTVPSPNTPSITYSVTGIQISNFDLVFFLPTRALPNSKARYALGYETTSNKLKVYLPATTGVIARSIPGGSYLHIGQPANIFDGTFGNNEPGYVPGIGNQSNVFTITAQPTAGQFFLLPYKDADFGDFTQAGVWYSVDGLGQVPLEIQFGTQIQIEVAILSTDTIEDVRDKTISALSAYAYWTFLAVGLDSFSAFDAMEGPRAIPNAGSTGWDVTFVAGNYDYNDLSADAFNSKLKVISDVAFRFKQLGYDMSAVGGIATINAVPIEIDTIQKEQFETVVVLKQPHGFTTYINPYGEETTDQLASLVAGQIVVDTDGDFPGPYLPDLAVNYTLRSEFVTTRDPLFAGTAQTTVQVNGTLPNEPGLLWVGLGTDTAEGPIRYLGVQVNSAPGAVGILNASQNGYVITVLCATAHGAVPGNSVNIAGTSTPIDGTHVVSNVINPTTLVLTSLTPYVGVALTGNLTVVVDNVRSTLLLDPSNVFKFNQPIGIDLTLLSSPDSYQPAKDGKSYPLYVTGTALGRIYANQLIEQISALGIGLEIVVIYPSDTGLGNAGDQSKTTIPPYSDIVYVYGPDDVYPSE